MILRVTFLLLVFTGFVFGCRKPEKQSDYKTRKLVIIVIDGPRFADTWGDSTHSLIPFRAQMKNDGVFCSAFYNDGGTYTMSGHSALTTGHYQVINNGGAESPGNPSFMQQWISHAHAASSRCMIISSKDKLEALKNCADPDWHNQYLPVADCGIAGYGSGYRDDSLTLEKSLSAIRDNHPDILLICFKEPDVAGHAGDSLQYIEGIIRTDVYVRKIYETLEASAHYFGVTTLMITNDHGRHSDSFISHGDNCDGCRHLEFIAIGPDFRENHICTKYYDLTDILPTIGVILNIPLLKTNGEVMWDLLEK